MRLNDLTPLIGPLVAVAICLGCTIGSFLNVVVWRVPQGMSLVTPPSHCPNCGHLIRPWENIPVLSWCFLRGRCSGCHLPISIRYPLGELATGVVFGGLFLACWMRNLPVAVLPGYFFLLGTLICVFQIDLRHRIIPDVITYSGMATALALALIFPSSRLIFGTDLSSSTSGAVLFRYVLRLFADTDITASPILAAALDCIAGCLLGTFILGIFAVPGSLIAKQNNATPPMGLGDMKFLAMTGAFLGMDSCLFIACFASIAALLFGITKIILTKRRIPQGIPFGPFLAIATLLWMLFGSPMRLF